MRELLPRDQYELPRPRSVTPLKPSSRYLAGEGLGISGGTWVVRSRIGLESKQDHLYMNQLPFSFLKAGRKLILTRDGLQIFKMLLDENRSLQSESRACALRY